MKPHGFSLVAICLTIFFLAGVAVAGPYAPAAGQSGSGAIHMDDSGFVAWATGYQDYLPGTNVDDQWKTPDKALGKAAGTSYDIVCLGRGGSITMTFDKPIIDSDGADFAVFENSFSDTYIEQAYVEVSTDGVVWHRFQSSSLTTDPVDGYGTVDPTDVYQLGCKYRQGYGEPYDLAQLGLSEINYVRIIDIVGDGSCTDSAGKVIYDPYPTWGSAGFDLDAIGVIHQKVYVGPTASFAVDPGNGMAPLSVQFTDTSTGDIDAWNWDFGDGNSSTEENPNHVYQDPGNYTVVLEVSGPAGSDTSTVIKAVQVQGEAPTAAFTFVPASGTAPLTVQFTDVSTGEITSWVWDFGNGVNNVVGQNPSHTYQEPGTYTVTLSVDGPYGGDQIAMNACITVTAPLSVPHADFGVAPSTGTAPLTVQFTDTSTGDIDAWNWDFGDGGSSTEPNPGHVYQEPGDYTVVLEVSGPAGSDTMTMNTVVHIQAPPPTAIAPTASFTMVPTRGAAPLTIQFSDASTGEVDFWSWNFGDGYISRVRNPVHTFNRPGNYEVILWVKGPGGSSQKVVTIVIMAPTPVMAAPAVPLEYATWRQPGDPFIDPSVRPVVVPPGPIYLQPRLTIVSADWGQPATVLLYACIDGTCFPLIQQQMAIAGEVLDFAPLLPMVIDLAGCDGLVADIYYGYVLNDGTIRYNAYRLQVQAGK